MPTLANYILSNWLRSIGRRPGPQKKLALGGRLWQRRMAVLDPAAAIGRRQHRRSESGFGDLTLPDCFQRLEMWRRPWRREVGAPSRQVVASRPLVRRGNHEATDRGHQH
jgi:hypothetical protein